MISNLNTYQQEEQTHRFVDNSANYSLTGYESVDPEDKDNAESKGVLNVFLFMGDSFNIMPLFLTNMLPFVPMMYFQWLLGMLVVVMGYFFTIAIYNAWKARKT